MPCSECGRSDAARMVRGLCITPCYSRLRYAGLLTPVRTMSTSADYRELAERYWLMYDGTESQRVLADRLGVGLHTLVRALTAERQQVIRTDHEDDYDYA